MLETFVLVVFYFETGGDEWIHHLEEPTSTTTTIGDGGALDDLQEEGWLGSDSRISDDDDDICQWSGIECEADETSSWIVTIDKCK